MKRFRYFFLALAALALAASCTQKEEPFQPGDPDVSGCYGVYFPVQDAAGSHTLTPADPTSVDIAVSRNNSSGSINVPYVITSDDENVFKFGDITFADGQSESTLHVDFSAAEPGKTYKFSVQILDKQYVSSYFDGATALDYSFMIVEWKKFFGPNAKEDDAVGHIYQIAWEEDYDTEMFYYETAYPNIRYCYLKDGWHGNKATTNYEFYWDTKTNNLFVPMQWMGYVNSNGLDVYASDAADFYNAYYSWGEVVPSQDYFDWAPAWMEKNGFFQPYYDGNGCFYLGDWTYIVSGGVPTGSGYQFGGDSEADADYFLAAGFIRTDFLLKGLTSDYAKDGVIPVYVYGGKDVTKAAFVVVPGQLTATQIANQVNAIAEGTAENVYTLEDFTEVEYDEKPSMAAAAEITLSETGLYTIVAVTYDDKGKVADSKSLLVTYVSAEDSEKYAVNLTVGAEATPSRYEGYDGKTSFAFYVVGKDITEAHVGIFEAAKYDADVDSYQAIVKADRDEELALSADAINAVNGEGGYYDIASGLSANTEYVVLVWATNGNEDGFATARFTTDGLPNEIVAEDGCFAYILVFNEEEGVPYYDYQPLEFNPNNGNYEIKNWGYGVTFSFSYDKETGKITVPQQPTGFADGTYGTIYVGDSSMLPQSWIDYFEIDVEPESYVDEDGNFHLYLSYISSESYYFGTGYEVYYIAGEPAETPDEPGDEPGEGEGSGEGDEPGEGEGEGEGSGEGDEPGEGEGEGEGSGEGSEGTTSVKANLGHVTIAKTVHSASYTGRNHVRTVNTIEVKVQSIAPRSGVSKANSPKKPVIDNVNTAFGR